MGTLRADDAVDESQLAAQHLAIEKQQRGERLILRRAADMEVDREARQEAVDLLLAEFGGVPLAMKDNEPLDPPHSPSRAQWDAASENSRRRASTPGGTPLCAHERDCHRRSRAGS